MLRWLESVLPTAILFIVVSETVIILLSYPEHFAHPVDTSNQKNVRERSTTLQGRALTLAGIAFTGFSILVSLSSDEGLSTVYGLLALSIGLLFISYQSKESTATRRGWSIIQEKSLSYGFISLFLSTAVLFRNTTGRVSPSLAIALILATSFRFNTVRQQISMYRRRRSKERKEITPDIRI